METETKYRKTFRSVQAQQWKKSLLVLMMTLAVYFLIFLMLATVTLWVPSLVVFSAPPGRMTLGVVVGSLIMAVVVGYYHYHMARHHGGEIVIEMLNARTPDLNDHLHQRFVNSVEEMRISAGLPHVGCMVLPVPAVNSLAITMPDNSPLIAVSEGMLAAFSREELQAAIAHELAHLISGDSFYITLLCSLAGCFDKMGKTLEEFCGLGGGRGQVSALGHRERGGFAHPVLIVYWVIISVGHAILRMYSTFISRERELLADATAVELTRNPVAMASAVYKANLKYSFMGDFSLSYAPMFLVNPSSEGVRDGHFFKNLRDTHPPLSRRMKLLGELANKPVPAIVKEIWERKENRQSNRQVMVSQEEWRELNSWDDSNPVTEEIPGMQRCYEVKRSATHWDGPFSIVELFSLPYYTNRIMLRHVDDPETERQANQWPDVLEFLKSRGSWNSGTRKCPRCATALVDTHYEHVPIMACPKCLGKLVKRHDMMKIFTREEVDFSPKLYELAAQTKRDAMINPGKVGPQRADAQENISCPGCSGRMMAKPYNYQFFILVDECYQCHSIWFDGDELEILQILVEDKRKPAK